MVEYRESCRRLQEAIASLNQYIQKSQKTLTKFSRVLLSKLIFSRKTEEEPILQAIDEIKSHRWLIHQLQLGTAEQKKLAESVMSTISKYNEIATTLNQKSRLWQRHLPKFLKKKIPFPVFPTSHPIELSLPVTVLHQSHELVQKTAGTSDALSASLLTLEEKNAFWMKGITLLKEAGNPYLTIARTQKEVLNAPITIHVDTLSKKMSLSTILTPLPGESYLFKGSFKCLPGGKRSLPLGKSFEITTHAIQTAFPDPLQYLGCFGNALIPPCPHRVQEAPLLAHILEKKLNIANALLPHGEYNPTAKEQLEQKKALFNRHRKELLPLHQRLIEHLVNDPQKLFFQHLYEREDALEQLADVYRQFVHLFIDAPFHHWQEKWLQNHSASPIFLSDALQNLKKENHQDPFERAKAEFLMGMGEVLSAPCHTLLMQHLSENLKICPPELKPFEKKLQQLLYRQLLTFFHELEEKKEITLEWLKTHMEAEIALFATPGSDALTQEAAGICEHLKNYFYSRHFR